MSLTKKQIACCLWTCVFLIFCNKGIYDVSDEPKHAAQFHGYEQVKCSTVMYGITVVCLRDSFVVFSLRFAFGFAVTNKPWARHVNFGTKVVNISASYEHDSKSKLWVWCVPSGYVAQFERRRCVCKYTSPRLKHFNLFKPTGYVMHQQFNIQQQYALPALYLCVLYLSESKQWLVPLTAYSDWFLYPRWKVFTARYGLGL
jgi:hypothetical protein